MLLASVLLGLAIAVAGEDTTEKEATTNSTDPATLEESLLKRRCVPTAVTRGPCHVCSCSSRGAYQCRSDDCRYYEHDSNQQSNQPECEPDMLYNEGALWCNCNDLGFWNSANCRDNFRYMRHKQAARPSPVVTGNVQCENGSLYAVDCNVCECRGEELTAAACTNRTCAAGGKADPCKVGQLARAGHQLCACSEIGYYVDQLCINLRTNDTVQKIMSADIATLNAEKKPALRQYCTPFSVIKRNCNRCTCTPSGSLVCTNMLCLSDPNPGKNVTKEIARALKRISSKTLSVLCYRPSRHQLLPELQSDNEPCEPGKQYRYRCNTCYCTKKRVPACTTMICLDFFGTPEKKIEAVRAPRIKQIQDVYNLPEIQEGQDCTQGKTYRVDCNVCRCSARNRLVCSKKLCLSPQQMSEQLEFENKMKINKIYSTKNKNVYMELFDDKVVIHQRTGNKHGKNIARSGPSNSSLRTKFDKNNLVDPKFQKKGNAKRNKKKVTKKVNNDKKENIKSDTDTSKQNVRSGLYPPLPKTKCNPGQIYMKDCQRCFCTFKKVAQCTNRPCKEMTGPILVPKDVFPRITPKEIANLPTLPHEAARCSPGKVYTVECNVCLCLANKNLLCNTQLCLAMDEVNKLAALKQNGKSCKVMKRINSREVKMLPPVTVDCIECSCTQGRFRCSAVDACTPFRFRRLLHGELNPKIKPKLSLDEKGGKCAPGMVYRQNCNNCYCQEDGSLRCTRKGCLNFQQVQKLKKQRQRLLKLGL